MEPKILDRPDHLEALSVDIDTWMIWSEERQQYSDMSFQFREIQEAELVEFGRASWCRWGGTVQVSIKRVLKTYNFVSVETAEFPKYPWSPALPVKAFYSSKPGVNHLIEMASDKWYTPEGRVDIGLVEEVPTMMCPYHLAVHGVGTFIDNFGLLKDLTKATRDLYLPEVGDSIFYDTRGQSKKCSDRHRAKRNYPGFVSWREVDPKLLNETIDEKSESAPGKDSEGSESSLDSDESSSAHGTNQSPSIRRSSRLALVPYNTDLRSSTGQRGAAAVESVRNENVKIKTETLSNSDGDNASERDTRTAMERLQQTVKQVKESMRAVAERPTMSLPKATKFRISSRHQQPHSEIAPDIAAVSTLPSSTLPFRQAPPRTPATTRTSTRPFMSARARTAAARAPAASEHQRASLKRARESILDEEEELDREAEEIIKRKRARLEERKRLLSENHSNEDK